LTFEIGRNANQSEDRPWNYVLVRHIPIVPDTFAFYGGDMLPTFNNLPTWKYATPHNIQRITAQNESCDTCHGNEALFLTADDVDPDELAANADVIVEDVPSKPHPGLGKYKIPQACVTCHPKAVEDDWELVSESVHALDWEVEPSGEAIACEDCHSPEGNFDWTLAGYSYSEADAAGLIWSEYPAIESPSPPPPGLNLFGLLAISAVVIGVAAVPLALVLRRDDK
jgi:hypothetical protein